MTSQPRGQPSRRRPLRNITHRYANAKRETPLIKTIARNTIKSLPPPPPPPPAHARRHTPGQRLRAGDVIIHQFSDLAHFNGAVRIFTRLPSIAGLAGVAPRLSGQDRDRLEIHLQYPKYGMWRVVDRLHSRSDPTTTRLRVHELRQLQKTFFHDMRILCASRIAPSSDVSFLRMVHQRTPFSSFVPLLDAFDLRISMCAEQDASTIDWTELETDMVRKVKTQFEVFEFLAQFESPTRSRRLSNVELDPGDAFRILQVHPPLDPGWCVVLLQVRRYTSEFARYTIERVDGLLLTLQKRASLPDHYPWPVLTNYTNAVRHMLRLSTTDEGAPQQDIHVLADRAYLRVLYAATLVHSHSKVMEHDFSKGLLQLDHPGPAEAYTSDEDFHSVTEACREAQEAIQALYDAGGKLERGARWFIRDLRSAVSPVT